MTSVVEWLRENGPATEAQIVSALGGERGPSAVKSELHRDHRAGRVYADAALKEGRGFRMLYYTDESQLQKAKNAYLPRLGIDEEIQRMVETAVVEAEKSGAYWSGSPEALTKEKIAAEVGRPVPKIEDAFSFVMKERGWKWDPNKEGFWKPFDKPKRGE